MSIEFHTNPSITFCVGPKCSEGKGKKGMQVMCRCGMLGMSYVRECGTRGSRAAISPRSLLVNALDQAIKQAARGSADISWKGNS